MLKYTKLLNYFILFGDGGDGGYGGKEEEEILWYFSGGGFGQSLLSEGISLAIISLRCWHFIFLIKEIHCLRHLYHICVHAIKFPKALISHFYSFSNSILYCKSLPKFYIFIFHYQVLNDILYVLYFFSFFCFIFFLYIYALLLLNTTTYNLQPTTTTTMIVSWIVEQ